MMAPGGDNTADKSLSFSIVAVTSDVGFAKGLGSEGSDLINYLICLWLHSGLLGGGDIWVK